MGAEPVCGVPAVSAAWLAGAAGAGVVGLAAGDVGAGWLETDEKPWASAPRHGARLPARTSRESTNTPDTLRCITTEIIRRAVAMLWRGSRDCAVPHACASPVVRLTHPTCRSPLPRAWFPPRKRRPRRVSP